MENRRTMLDTGSTSSIGTGGRTVPTRGDTVLPRGTPAEPPGPEPAVTAGSSTPRIRTVNHVVVNQRRAVNHLNYRAEANRTAPAIARSSRSQQKQWVSSVQQDGDAPAQLRRCPMHAAQRSDHGLGVGGGKG